MLKQSAVANKEQAQDIAQQNIMPPNPREEKIDKDNF